jgi:hypothetical protein
LGRQPIQKTRGVGRGFRVVPQLSRPNRFIGAIEHDQPMPLAAHGYCGDRWNEGRNLVES